MTEISEKILLLNENQLLFDEDLKRITKLKNALLCGDFSKRNYKFYFLSIFGILLICQFISIFLFPDGYTIVDNCISQLGSLKKNPIGHWFFNIGLIFTGIFSLPSFLYIHKRFSMFPSGLISQLLNHLSMGLSAIGLSGFAFVGIFPEEFDIFHDVSAGLAFGGFFLAQFFIMFLILYKMNHARRFKGKNYKLFIFLAVYGQLIAVWTIVISNSIIFGSFRIIIENPLLEWSIYISDLIWILSMLVL
ncbi:MAG: DUF998 domain-containing protein [Promethearchaeota archaeon]